MLSKLWNSVITNIISFQEGNDYHTAILCGWNFQKLRQLRLKFKNLDICALHCEKVIGNYRDVKNKINGLQHQWPVCLHLLRVGQCLLAKHHKLILNVFRCR